MIYHLAARVGLSMAYVQSNTSPVWPPTGIALAALLLFGYEYWPGVSLGVLLGSLLTGADPVLALGMTVGNTLEALAGAYLLKRFVRFQNSLSALRDVVGLGGVAIASTAISATIGTTTLILTRVGDWAAFGPIWITWWIGDLLGALVVAPVLLVWFSRPYYRARRQQSVEGLIVLGLLILVAGYVFAGKPPDGILHQALIYLIFPFVIWAALRHEQHGATLAVLIVSGIAISATVRGLGPFSLESKNDSLVLLQTFMAVVSLTALILAAATAERRRAAEELRQRAEELATLNDSSRTFLDNSDVSSIYHTICRLAVTRLGLDVAWIETRRGDADSNKAVALYGMPVDCPPPDTSLWMSVPACEAESGAQIRLNAATIMPPSAPGKLLASAAFPLLFSNERIGTLNLLSSCREFFTEDKQILIQSFANLAAVAVQNGLLFDEARLTNRQLHGLSQRLLQAQEAERLHLSRELHDESGQLLAALAVQLGLLERDIDNPRAVHERVGSLKATANAIQENLHGLAVNLRPASLDHVGLVTTLRQFIQDFSRQHNIDVDFEAVGLKDKRPPLEIETAFFRIVQESLTNVVLHAQATRVDVVLSSADQKLTAIVEDNGIGFSPAVAITEDQMGLFGMRERVEMLGGSFTIESSPGKGTTVKAQVPWND